MSRFTLAAFARRTRRPSVVVPALALALSLAAGARAQTTALPPLTLEQAVQAAEARSQQLAAQSAAATAARHMAVAAGQRADPVLKAGISNLPVEGPDRFSLTRDSMTMRSIGVMQEFTRGEKRRARAARFEREAEVAEAARWVATANLQRDAAMAWLDRHYQERMLALLKTQRDETRLQGEAADAAYRGGRGAQADVFAARTALAQLEDRIAAAERQLGSAATMLARWVGDGAAAPLAPPPDMTAVRLDVAHLDVVLTHHPDLALRHKQEEVAQAEVDMARAERKSDWAAEVMYSQRGPAFDNMVSISVSVPLQWNARERQDREVAAKLATLEQLRAERAEMTREHVAQTRAMLQEWDSTRARLARYDASIVPLAAQRTRAALAAYRGGAGRLADVLEARRMEIDTGMERLRLEMDAARLWAQLNYLVPAGHDPVTPRP